MTGPRNLFHFFQGQDTRSRRPDRCLTCTNAHASRDGRTDGVAAGGRIYVAGREGTTSVITAGTTFEVLAANQLEDGFDASPAVAGGEIYLRGRQYLYCIAADSPRARAGG